MHHQGAVPLERLDDEVAVCHAAYRVPQEIVEAELVGDYLAVNSKWVIGQGAAAQRALVDLVSRLEQPLEVGREDKAVAMWCSYQRGSGNSGVKYGKQDEKGRVVCPSNGRQNERRILTGGTSQLIEYLEDRASCRGLAHCKNC